MITANHPPRKLVLALAVYLTSLIAANTLGLKLMPFLLGSHLSVAVFSFPIVFLMTDVVGEVYGKAWARTFVIAGFVTTLLFAFYSVVSVLAPWSADALWAKEGYNQVFGGSIRFSVASVAAFGLGEYQDVLTFFFFTSKMGHRLFWLRSTLSNLWSQCVDTAVFMLIAFAGIYPLKTILLIAIPWWLLKVAMGFLYTPLSYAGLYLLKKE